MGKSALLSAWLARRTAAGDLVPHQQGCAAIRLEGQADSDRLQLKVRSGVDAARLVLAAASETSHGEHAATPRLASQSTAAEKASAVRSQVDIGILTIRDDEFRAVLAVFPDKAGTRFYGALMDSELWPEIGTISRIDVAPLRGKALRQAIVEPAVHAGVQLEPRLYDRRVADAAAEPGVLPLVQETLRMLWEMRSQQTLGLREIAVDLVPSWSRPVRPTSSASASAICPGASSRAVCSCWASSTSPVSAAAIRARPSAASGDEPLTGAPLSANSVVISTIPPGSSARHLF